MPMNECYNNAIIVFMVFLQDFCKANKSVFMNGVDFGRLNTTQKKTYIKKTFEKSAITIYKGLTEQKLPEYAEKDKKGVLTVEERKKYLQYMEVRDVARVIKSGVEKAEGLIEGSAERMNCFLHDDEKPSMNYVSGVNSGFYCYSCGEKGKIIDIFNLIDLMNIWHDKGHMKFVEQMSVAASLFVNGTVSSDKSEDSHTDYIPYTSSMVKIMHAPALKLTKAKDDNNAVAYLKSRGITPYVANRLGVMVQYPTNELGKPIGRGCLVFINGNGSYSHRVFMEDAELVKSQGYEVGLRWYNSKNNEVGIFNEQVVEHCEKFGQTLFICEGAFDCMSVESLGFHAVSVNSTANAFTFYDRVLKEKNIKCICLADTDDAGKKMAKALSTCNGKIYIPDFYSNDNSDNFISKYKDINECLLADKIQTQHALKGLEDKAKTFFSF